MELIEVRTALVLALSVNRLILIFWAAELSTQGSGSAIYEGITTFSDVRPNADERRCQRAPFGAKSCKGRVPGVEVESDGMEVGALGCEGASRRF